MKLNHAGAVLALWNDVDHARIDEYERWHAIEHVPERVWVPGFIGATRYIADRAGQPRYFTLYELQSLECLDTPIYRTLVDEPTPWSASMRPAFTSFQRVTCELAVDAGSVTGAGLVAVRAVWPPAATPNSATLMALADALLAGGDVTRVQVGAAAPAGPQALPNQRSAPPGNELLFLVQTLRDEALEMLGARARDAIGALGSSTWHEHTTYRFASRVLHSDVTAAHRPSPRLDLMR